MSLPNETEVARLLREISERDAQLKALNADTHVRGPRTSLTGIQTQMDALRTADIVEQLQPPALRATEVAKQLQAPALRAAEIARQLQEPALRAADIAKQFQEPALRAAEMAKRLSSIARPTSNAQPQVRSAELPVRTVADLGPMIRKARKAMKLNQADFAAHAGVGRRFISELEGGKGTLEFDKVIACAIAAGIDIGARNRKS